MVVDLVVMVGSRSHLNIEIEIQTFLSIFLDQSYNEVFIYELYWPDMFGRIRIWVKSARIRNPDSVSFWAWKSRFFCFCRLYPWPSFFLWHVRFRTKGKFLAPKIDHIILQDISNLCDFCLYFSQHFFTFQKCPDLGESRYYIKV